MIKAKTMLIMWGLNETGMRFSGFPLAFWSYGDDCRVYLLFRGKWYSSHNLKGGIQRSRGWGG